MFQRATKLSTGCLIAVAALVVNGTAGADSPPDRAHAGISLSTTRAVTPLVPAGIRGNDVSGWQGNVDWNAVKAAGAQFSFVKATEGTGYTNPYFAQQYVGSYDVGLVRGAYHFALPDVSGGAAQADYFADHGGAWSADNQTLPGALDIEWNPYGAACFGLSDSQMVTWIEDFVNRYHARTGRWPVIYTATNWWVDCTGNYAGLANRSPLWIANYTGTAYPLPAGWSFYTFWQWDDEGTFPGDQNVFNGSSDRLVALANNSS